MNNTKTALLVMDMQVPFLSRFPDQGKELISKVKEAIAFARQKNMLIIFTRLGFRKGLPEINTQNTMFAKLKENLKDSDLEAFMQISPGLGLKESDIIVDKKRISAFSGDDLDLILRAGNVSNLVLTGITTSGVVLSTFKEALDKDYRLTVLSDGCKDNDKETQDFILKKLFKGEGAVLTVDEWEKSLGGN